MNGAIAKQVTTAIRCKRNMTPNAGVVAKIIDKQEPTAEEIAKNFDQMRDQLLEERRNDAFSIFASNVLAEYRKHNLVQFNTKAQNPQIPGM